MKLYAENQGQTLPIDSVSKQRELLNNFAEEWNYPHNSKNELIFDRDIEEFIKSKNIS